MLEGLFAGGITLAIVSGCILVIGILSLCGKLMEDRRPSWKEQICIVVVAALLVCSVAVSTGAYYELGWNEKPDKECCYD